MEPFEIQRKICRDIRDSLYPLVTEKALHILPFNRFVAVDEGSPGWVWLSPVNDKACHQYGKFVVRLDGDNVSVGYAVERGFPPEVAAAVGCKPLGPDWTWHRVMADMRSGKIFDAAITARAAGCPLTLYAGISPWKGPRTNCALVLADDGRLSASSAIPGAKNNATALKACEDMAGVADVLDAADSTSYVDLQFLATFDVVADPDGLWSPSQFHARLLKHFEPWVAFPS